MTTSTTSRARLAAIAAWLVTVALVGASLGVRLWHRGDVIPGWDVTGVAEGAFLLETRSLPELVRWQIDSIHSTDFWNIRVLPSVLLPGALARAWPWLYWGHTVSFALALVSLAVLASAFRLGWRGGWFVLLAWATSSALVSQSVTGHANGSAILPHALAWWVVLRLRGRPLATIAAGVGIWLVGWQVQELGRTTSLTFLCAALLVRADRSTRLAWLAVGGAILLDALVYPSQNTNSFTSVGIPTLQVAWDTAKGIALGLFAPPKIDLPSLLVLGVTSALLVKTDGWLWRALLVLQLGLVVVLALQRGVPAVMPRRFMLVDFCALAATVALFAELMRTGRRWPLGVLVLAAVLGASWQLVDTIRFMRAGAVGTSLRHFSLPFVHSSVDYQASWTDAEWTRRMLADVDAGKRLVLAYNMSSYAEDPTNPSAIPERLYLSLGPERYETSVRFFGEAWRWNHIRARPAAEIETFVESIDDPDEWVGWYSIHINDAWESPPAVRRRREVGALLAALERRFVLRWEPPIADESSQTYRFTLGERPAYVADAACHEPAPFQPACFR